MRRKITFGFFWMMLLSTLFGCGDSDRPPALPDYSNYSMPQHARDMLAALDALDIPFCHLATHSTGGIIAARMLLMQPQRFGRVFALDPVTPLEKSAT